MYRTYFFFLLICIQLLLLYKGQVYGQNTVKKASNPNMPAADDSVGKKQSASIIWGSHTFNDGAKCTGYWYHGMLNGEGECIYANGDVYSGDFKDGAYDGQGILTLKDYGRYNGSWENGGKNGQGKLSLKQGSYAGNWQNNRLDGECVYIDSALNRYEGRYVDGLPHGLFRVYGHDGGIELRQIEKGKFVSSTMLESKPYAGLGFLLDINEKKKRLYLKAIIDDSPAFHAGLQVNDYIKKVNGTILKGKSVAEAINLLSGEVGGVVLLDVVRGRRSFSLEVKRSMLVSIPSISNDTSNSGTTARAFNFFDLMGEAITTSAAEAEFEKHRLVLVENSSNYKNEGITVKCGNWPKRIESVIYRDNHSSRLPFDLKWDMDPFAVKKFVEELGATSVNIAFDDKYKKNMTVSFVLQNKYGKVYCLWRDAGLKQIVTNKNDEPTEYHLKHLTLSLFDKIFLEHKELMDRLSKATIEDSLRFAHTLIKESTKFSSNERLIFRTVKSGQLIFMAIPGDTKLETILRYRFYGQNWQIAESWTTLNGVTSTMINNVNGDYLEVEARYALKVDEPLKLVVMLKSPNRDWYSVRRNESNIKNMSNVKGMNLYLLHERSELVGKTPLHYNLKEKGRYVIYALTPFDVTANLKFTYSDGSTNQDADERKYVAYSIARVNEGESLDIYCSHESDTPKPVVLLIFR